MGKDPTVLKGRCTCNYVQYEITSSPLIVHCCHCRNCQRQSGAAFALNALFDADSVYVSSGETHEIVADTPSGQGQPITRCPKCATAVWSSYYMHGLREMILFIRVGTLDEPDLFPPDVHIFTTSKQPWVALPPDAISFNEFYEIDEVWPLESKNIRKSLLKKMPGQGLN